MVFKQALAPGGHKESSFFIFTFNKFQSTRDTTISPGEDTTICPPQGYIRDNAISPDNDITICPTQEVSSKSPAT